MKAPQRLRVPRFVHDWRRELCGQKQWRGSRIGSLVSVYNWCDPTSSSWRVAVLGHVQNPLQCERIEDVGSGFAKKRQYAEYSNRDGTPCRVQDDSLMAVM